MTIRAVLFDSGGTLTRTVDPDREFREILVRHWPDAPVEDLSDALASGAAMLQRLPASASRERYHRTVLAELGMGRPPEPLLAELDRAELDRAELGGAGPRPFPEVPDVLRRLHERGLSIAVVTDSLGTAESERRDYERIGLAEYVRFFAVAGELGRTKPDPALYRAASDALGVPAHETCYVDDHAGLVAAGITLGYHGFAVCRDGAPRPSDVPWIPTLASLPERLTETR
ncbi:HAD-IA family hydrolase [Actinoplanes missouriensis]|uniref:HAD family hydrolase n=1 Tax=Actinoplanes missouriensis TaxID=1866 RepID=UPI0033E89911